MTQTDLDAAAQKLQTERLAFERERLEFEQRRASRLTGIISVVAVVVSCMQVWVATRQVRIADQQRALAEAQTFEQFIPLLLQPQTKDLALTTMEPFVNRDVVLKLGRMLRATAAVEQLSEQGTPAERDSAQQVLTALDRQRAGLVEQLFSAERATRIAATTELVRHWSGDARLVEDVLDVAATHLDNRSGTINALVVLREAAPEVLRTHAETLGPFLAAARQNGQQTAALADAVAQRSAQQAPGAAY